MNVCASADATGEGGYSQYDYGRCSFAEKEETLTPLHCACLAVVESMDCLTFLLAQKPNVEARHDGFTPLHLALSSEKSLPFIQALLDAHADPKQLPSAGFRHKIGEKVQSVCSLTNDVAIRDLLIKHGAVDLKHVPESTVVLQKLKCGKCGHDSIETDAKFCSHCGNILNSK